MLHDLNSLGYSHDLGNLPDVAHVTGFRSFQAAPVDRSARSSARALGLAEVADLGPWALGLEGGFAISGVYDRYIWVNYNDLTATSLESWLVRENIPK